VLPEVLGLGFVATLVAGFVAVGAVAKYALNVQSKVATVHEGQALARTFAAALGSARADNEQAVQDLLQELCGSSSVCTVRWFEPSGRLKYQWPVDYSGLAAGGADHAETGSTAVAATVETTERATYTAPIYSNAGENVGTVHVQVVPSSLSEHTAHLWNPYALALGTTLVMFVFLYRQLRHRLRPVVALQSSLQNYAAGVEQELIALRLSDSLGPLAESWNRLVDEVSIWQQQARNGSGGGLDHEVVQRYETRALRQILERLPFGVLGVGHDQRVTYANASSGELLHRSQDELVGQSLADAVGEETVARAVAGGGARAGSAMSIDRNRGEGDEQVMLRFMVLPPSSEEAGEALITIQDVSHLREAERARDNFLYHVTHELRTPLTNINAYTETLTKQEFDDEQTRKECYNVIISETRRLSRLVENILNVSQLEVGTARLEMGDVDLLRLVRQMVQDNLGAADEKGIDLTLKLPPKVPKIRADKQRLGVLLNNLIGNAIKYTPDGGQVDVVLRVTDRSVEVVVADTGVGIDAADQPRVFDKFYRAGSDSVQSIPGTGLGLAIAREVARLHGGDIDLTSEPGKGSTFTVHLPTPSTGS